jgi:hypothetical protein
MFHQRWNQKKFVTRDLSRSMQSRHAINQYMFSRLYDFVLEILTTLNKPLVYVDVNQAFVA